MFEPGTESIKEVSGDITKTMAETSKVDNKALTNLSDKTLDILSDSIY